MKRLALLSLLVLLAFPMSAGAQDEDPKDTTIEIPEHPPPFVEQVVTPDPVSELETLTALLEEVVATQVDDTGVPVVVQPGVNPEKDVTPSVNGETEGVDQGGT